MQTDERFKLMLSATAETLDAVDAALSGRHEVGGQSLRLLRMGQAAAETGLSRTTIWRAIREKRLKAVEIRKGSYRISEMELKRFAGHNT